MRAHLMKIPGTGISGCMSVKSNHLADFRRAEEEYENKNIKNAQKIVPIPPIATGTHQNQLYMPPPSNEPSKKRKVEEFIEKGFNRQGRRELDALIARFFYSSGLPFHVARNPYYSACISYAANNNLSGYTPPGYNLLRDRLLQSEKSNVDRLLKPIKSTWREKGVSIVSDGWSDSQRRPLINFLAVTENGPMFLKVVDCSGETKDKHFIYTLMKEVIEEVGSENVVQVITDNAKNCAGAGKLIQDEYKNIFWTPCVVHTLSLALQNICAAKNVESNQVTYDECSWISIVSADVNMIKNFIMNHGKRLDMFNTFVPLKLLSIAPTRFASVVVMLRRFKLLKQSLGVMVMSTEWNAYREDDVIKAKFVKDKVIDDIWWDQIDYILAFTGPIYDMLRECDTDRPSLHLVYDMWDSMIEKVRHAIYENEKKQVGESSSFYDVVYDILISRWTKNNTPLHCLAHSLNPRYYSQRWLNEDRARVPPHRDNEVSKERMACLKKYFVEPGVRERATLEFANFSSNGEDFADSDSIDHRSSMDPKSWWVTYGASAPILQSFNLWL